MKLISKYNRVNIPITIIILLISSISYYFILHFVLTKQLDKDLKLEKQEILHEVQEVDKLPETSNFKDQQILFTPSKDGKFKNKFSTENIYDTKEKEYQTFRRLDFSLKIKGEYYIATVKKSQQETEDIIQLILLITFLVIVFLLLVQFIANRVLLRKLWRPFNNTLEELKEFKVSGENEMKLGATEIDEFAELNRTVILMTNKVKGDYDSLKRFTENASHEIQTPLAIIKTKIELLAQSELNERQANVIQTLNDVVNRLSKLNQSLLLLTKIENGQFADTECVNISKVLERHIINFEELAEAKNITITKNVFEECEVKMNESLAVVLISNVMVNAIKHNHSHGIIDIKLEGNTLSISNTGEVPTKGTSSLFERFEKDTSSVDSLGLGLAIVKEICDRYGFRVNYNYADKMHIVSIQFA